MGLRHSTVGLCNRFAALAVAVSLLFGASAAFAQSDLEQAQGAANTTPPPPSAEAPPSTTPAADDGSTAATADQKPQDNLLSFYYKALGLKYTIAFGLLSFWFVAQLVMNILALRRDSVVPVSLIENFEGMLNEKRYQEAYELAKADESFLGQVLSAGLGKLSAGYPQAIEAMQEVGEEETLKLEQRLSYVALIGTIAPMVGLLGTVDGMVASFRVIATSTTQPKPSELAEGISMALITTLVGLVLAIPAIGLFGFLKNRLARLILEAGVLSEGLMSRFSSVGAGKKV